MQITRPDFNAAFDVGVFKKGGHRMISMFGGRNLWHEDYICGRELID